MKCLLLHCGSFHYKLDHPTPAADKNVLEHENAYENALIAFIAAERGDDVRCIQKASGDIVSLATKVGAGSIVINPFAHLSANLGKPDEARVNLEALAQLIETQTEMPVHYTSFGWYKSFGMEVLGHGDSQVFRSYCP